VKGAVGIVTGGIVMLTLVTAALIPAEAGPRAGEDLGAWITEAFSSVEEAFETTWEKAFEKSWRETFDEGIDDEVKSRFKETFRVSFEDTFKTAFEEAWGEAAEHVEHLEEHGAWNADGEFDADKTEWKDTLTFEEAADGLNALDLSTVNGAIDIQGVDDETVRIVAHRVVRSTDEAKGAVYREEFRPILTREDGTLVVKTHYHDNGKQTPKHIKEAKMAYEVRLPSRFVVAAKTVNGEVRVVGTRDDATLHTVNGTLTFETDESVSGGVHGKTVNGDITVRAAGLGDHSQLETVNGGIHVTAGGHFGGGLHAKTLNGDVNLTVPGDAAFDLRGKVGMHGSIRTAWGRPEGKRRMFGSSYETAVNGGGDDVRLETFNGSVEVDTAN
jgi:hypothetical protein